MKTRRRHLLVAAAATMALVPALAACGSPSASPTSEGPKAVNIAYLAYIASDFSKAFVTGAEEVVKPGGGSVTVFSSDFDPAKQNAQCEDAITSGRYNAILIAPVDPTTAVPCVNAANAAGIPVATLETAVGTDPYSLKPQVEGVKVVAGTQLKSQVDASVELITAACADANPCKMVAEVSSPTDRWTNDVVNGIRDAMGAKLDLVAVIPSMYDPGELVRALPDVLTANPGVNVFYGVSDQSAAAATSVLTPGIKALGLGGSTEAIAGIKDGSIFGTTGTWPVQSGKLIAEGLTQAVNGETITQPEIDLTTVDAPLVVTSENVAEFTPEWGSTGSH